MTQCLLIGTYLQVSQRYIVKASATDDKVLLIVARDANKLPYTFLIFTRVDV